MVRHGILVLASPKYAQLPYDRWLADARVPLSAVAAAHAPPAAQFEHVTLVSDYKDVDTIVQQARELHAAHRYDRVIGLGEADILPAARVREALGLEGQWEESATAYRDKLAMKVHAASAGVAVPAFASVTDVTDVEAFMARHGAPVMLKPRREGGSLGVRRIDDVEQVRALQPPLEPDAMIVEAFVEGPTFHVDALREAGEMVLAVPCAYTGDGCLSHWTDSGNGSFTLARTNPLYPRLNQATERVLDALPGPPDLAIHAEFFLTGSDELVFCEAASRVGGVPVPAMLTRLLGVDMRELWCRVQCDLAVDWAALAAHLERAPLVANYGLPPRDGRLRTMPASAPRGTEDLELMAAAGDSYAGARYAGRTSGDFIATWVVTADSEPEILEKIAATERVMQDAVAWELCPQPSGSSA